MTASPASPLADFHYLDTLWFQVSGTLCNLRCTHCFISCSPENHTLEMMETTQIFENLEKARRLGVKEIYYTGGEPFIHRDFLHILERTLLDFPTSVLTNGLPIDERRADRLQELATSSPYSLEMRISLDDYEEEKNDAIRGKGTFRKILAAYKRLYDRGLLPILTVTEIRSYLDENGPDGAAYEKYVDLLRSIGVDRPRIKLIPIFEMGMLDAPHHPPNVTHEMMQPFDSTLLQCSSSRIVSHEGVYACPILVGEREARMGNSIEEALEPCSLYHSSCHTCYVTGMTCKNF